MANSGVISTKVASNYELSIEWTSSPNNTSNYSTVTAKMYWEADRYGSINSSTVKDGAIIIDGTTYTFSGSGLADLNPGQKKLLATKSKNVYHNSDGSKSFSLDGYFDADVTLSGTKYSRINLTAKTFTLDPIPRKSSLTSSVSFTAGSDFTLTISRASSSFSHKAYIDVQEADGSWTYIKVVDFSTSETSKSSAFDVTAKTRIFTALNGRSSATFRINLNTFNGSDNLGYNTYIGKVTTPTSSYSVATNGQAGADNKVYIDQAVALEVTRYDGEFSHTLEITLGSFKKTITGVSTSTNWTPSDTEKSSLYAAIGADSLGGTGRIRTYTYYNGVQVGTYRDTDLYFYIRSTSSMPTFPGTGITYEDVNAVTAAVTGTPTYIIQNKSSLRVKIPNGAKATAKNGASIKTYSVTVNGATKTINSAAGDLTIDYGVIGSATNVVATVSATDTRGLSTTVPLTITVVPYTNPVVNYTVKRRNNFESSVDLTLAGLISPITIGGVQKNNLQALSGASSALQYRYKENVAGATFTVWKDFTFTPSGAAYTATPVTEVLDSTKTYVFEIRVTDKLSTATVSKTVTSGRPILFIDPVKNSVGIGMFPLTEKALYTQGEVHVGNPADTTQEMFLGFLNNQPRIRVGGTTKGLDIQGTGDISLLKLDNSGNATLGGRMNMPVTPKAPDFANGWSAYYGGAYFRTVDGVVYMRGMMRYGTFGTGTGTGAVKCFTITDSSCHPLQNQVFYAFNNSMDVIRIDVLTDGTGQIYNNKTLNASNDWVNLNGIYWTVV